MHHRLTGPLQRKMVTMAQDHSQSQPKERVVAMFAAISRLKEKVAFKGKKDGSRKLFLAWIAYQAVKGTLTTCFIWLPMLYYYFFKG